MASIEECRGALEELGKMMGRAKGDIRKATSHERTLSCTVPDLGVTFTGQLREGGLHDITTDPAPKAQIRFTVKSDDLVDLVVKRTLSVGSALTHGKLRVHANPIDLLRLRSMLS